MRRIDPIVVGFSLVSVLFVTVKVIPILWGLTLGFTASSAFSPTPVFVGLENFAIILGDPAFWSALGVGVVYAAATTALQVVVGVAAALLLFKHGGPATRSMALLPYMIPAVTGVLAWRWISDGLYGIANHLLLAWGVVAQPISFASSPGWAMPLAIAASVWQFTPFVVLVILATLSGIPGTIYEASRIDGTTWWSELRYITLPMLRSAVLLIVLLRSIWMFNRFDIIYLLTGGGPRGATTTLPLYAYVQAFVENDFGTAGAASSVIFCLLLTFGIIYLRAFQPEREVVRA
jgi:multiple sugar transport system permease protein